MFTRQVIISLLCVQCYIILCLGMCDQRKFGGSLKCCDKKDSKCFVKVYSNRTRGLPNKICYCDSYCKFTDDCCEDQKKVEKLCYKQGMYDHDKFPYLFCLIIYFKGRNCRGKKNSREENVARNFSRLSRHFLYATILFCTARDF